MESSFVSDDSLLEETARVDDLLDLDATVDYYENRINGIKRSGILAVLGPFGSGKSTMLHQVERRLEGKVTWINFDAWKYPERKDLWEGFILDFADQIGDKKKVQSKMDGKRKGLAKGKALTSIITALSGLGGIADGVFKLFEGAPVTRVFELQSLLEQMIEKQGRDTIIVVEDIDRSGDYGLRFLETLRDFLHELKIEHKCLVIAPIGDSEFTVNQPVYHKCIDYFEHFRLRDVKLATFVDRVFRPDLFEGECKDHNNRVRWTGKNRRGQICSFLEILISPRAQISMRTIKTILRNAGLTFVQQVDDGFEPDFRATIGFEAAKYITVGTEPKSTLFEQFRESRSVGRNTWLGALLYSMARDHPSILVRSRTGDKLEPTNPPVDIKLVVHTGEHGQLEFIPQYWENRYANPENGEEPHRLELSDFYLRY